MERIGDESFSPHDSDEALPRMTSEDSTMAVPTPPPPNQERRMTQDRAQRSASSPSNARAENASSLATSFGARASMPRSAASPTSTSLRLNVASDAAQPVKHAPECDAMYACYHPGPTAGGAPVHRLRFRSHGRALGERDGLGPCAAGAHAGLILW